MIGPSSRQGGIDRSAATRGIPAIGEVHELAQAACIGIAILIQ